MALSAHFHRLAPPLAGGVRKVLGQARACLGSIASVKRDDSGRLLKVNWSDGAESQFAYAWLRDNAHESHTSDRSARNRARHLLMADLDTKIVPVETNLAEDGDAVQVTWPDSAGGALQSVYSCEWLRARDMTTHERRRDRRAFHNFPNLSWGGDNVHTEIVDKAANWRRLMQDDQYLCEHLIKFLSYGLMFVKGCPEKPGTLGELGKRVGYLLNSHYGKKNDPSVV